MLVIGFLPGQALDERRLRATRACCAGRPTACRRLHAGPAVRRRLRHVRAPGGVPRHACASAAIALPPATTTTPTRGPTYAARSRPRRGPTVPCNNDLLAGQLHRRRRAGVADRLRVLRQQRRLLRARQHRHRVRLHARAGRGVDRGLLRRPRPARDLARVRLQTLCSEYGWSLWGFIQAAASPIDFDFHGWGMERFDKAAATFRGPDLARLLRGGGDRWLTCPTRARGRDRRRRRHRHLGGLPPDQARLDRRAAARAGHAVVRHDVARGRAGRAAARVRERHPAGAVLRRALRLARGRDRPGDRLPQRRRRDRGAHRGPDGPAAPHGGQRGGVRHGVRAALARRGPRSCGR